MPPKVNFSREEILNEAFEIVRQEGLQALSARRIAKNLHSSTQPIYREFESMKQLEAEIIARAGEYAVAYFLRNEKGEEPFLSIGLRYVSFALEEKELFQLLYMSEHGKGCFSILNSPFDLLLERMKQDPHMKALDEAALKRILKHIGIFTHGLTTLIHAGALPPSEESVRENLYHMGQVLIEWEHYQVHKQVDFKEEGCGTRNLPESIPVY